MGDTPWAGALRPGPHSGSWAGPLTLEHLEIGRVRLPTGLIVVCDPIVDPDVLPYARTVAPGEYPVRLALGRTADGEERLAAAWIAFADTPVTTWLGATTKGSGATKNLGKGLAHPVDSSNSAFMSPEAAKVLDARLDDAYHDAVNELMQASPGWGFAVLEWPEHPTLNAVLFQTDSDGIYPTYWGDDASACPVVLLTDFGLLDPPGTPTPPRPWWKLW
ncbi:MAG TPA: DUF4241 domain-containing protein [Gemmatimonadales bacterium]|nr:DUF4241 domain-containing protein [Gemmatimonadales bacterium]